MAATICPTITVSDEKEYNAKLQTIVQFSRRIHVDLADGLFAPQLISLDSIWWPPATLADLHVMYKTPFEYSNEIIALAPQLVVVHAEAEGDLVNFSKLLHRHGIEFGVALLQDTQVEKIAAKLDTIDHVLIFSGKLGFHGGVADLSLLEKAKQLRGLKATLELGWDGGINDQNTQALTEGGIDVLNVGGFIANAADPQSAYDKLKEIVGS